MMTIAVQSVQSLLIVMQRQGKQLGTGTGFVAQTGMGPVLLTNWHNVSGRRPDTRQPGGPARGRDLGRPPESRRREA
jgi:hypothetical protein